jgi:hypothetical protein
MKSSGAFPRIILIASVLNSLVFRALALKIENGDPLTHPALSIIHQRSPVVAGGIAHQGIPPLPETSESVVPTASRCVVILCCQFVVFHIALALCRTFHELTNTAKGKVEAALRSAAQTLTYGPMLCVLFTACQMRVEYLSHGKDQPQDWVQKCMYGLTFSVMVSALLALAIQLVVGKPLPPKVGPFDLEMPEELEDSSKVAFYALSVLRYLVLFAMYGGIAGVMIGILTYLPPGSVELRDIDAPVPAITCAMVLTVVFFSTQLVISLCRSYSEFTRIEFPQIVGMMHAASTIMEYAPMLAVLFLAARMRALQHNVQMQDWTEACMFAATGAMCVTSLLAIMVPATMGASLKKDKWTHEVRLEIPKPILGYIFIALRYCCMCCVYGGAAGVMLSMFILQSPGRTDTLPVSPTIQCVANLTCQFFFVYFLMTAMLTMSELTGGTVPVEKWSWFSAVEAARSTMAFAPMLSILFVATRMHALWITGKQGAPQSWVQDGMFMATWSLQISGLMCLGTGLLMAKIEANQDGNVVNKFSNRFVGIIVVAIRYMSMLLLCGGMLIVTVGLFTMTSTSANGRGSMPHAAQAISASTSSLH